MEFPNWVQIKKNILYSSPGVDCKSLLWEIAIIKNMCYHEKKLPLNGSYLLSLLCVSSMDSCLRSAGLSQVHFYSHSSIRKQLLQKLKRILLSPLFRSRKTIHNHNFQKKKFLRVISCKGSHRLFCHVSLIQICPIAWDKAGDISKIVTTIIAARRNWTIDHNAGKACDITIKVFTCIKIAWDRVGNMFATVLTIIATIWRPGFIWHTLSCCSSCSKDTCNPVCRKP